MSKDRRDVIKTVRFTSKEYHNVMKAARDCDMKFSAYVKKMLGKNSSYDPKLRAYVNRLANEVNRIGHNINQIVKNNNSELYSEMDKARLMEYMRILNEKVDLLLEQNGNK